MHPKANIAVDQWAWLSTYPKLTHDQAVKRIMKYLKGMDMQGLIVKPDPENFIEYYIDADFTVCGIKKKLRTMAQSCL